MVTGDPYYAGAGLSKYYGRTKEMIADLQTQYNIALTQERMEQAGYIWTENTEAEVNTEDGKIQMVFQSLE